MQSIASQCFPNHSHSDYPLKGDNFEKNGHLEGEIFFQKFPFLGEMLSMQKILRFGGLGEAFLFADVADCMDDGDDHHQEADLAMHASEGSVPIAAEPDDCGRKACDSGQQEHPPEDARRGVAVLCKPGEPVAFPVMQVDMVKGENCK